MKKKLRKALSQRIQALRNAASISQQELATRADLSVSQVAKLEQGAKADPRTSTILALAGALGVKPGRILDDLLPPQKVAGKAEPDDSAAATTQDEPRKNGKKPSSKKKGRKEEDESK